MSIPVTFTDEDLARGTLVTPAWYRVAINSVTQKPSKDGGSTNFIMDGKIICNADDGSTEFSGVPLRWNFNSKAPGFMQGLFKALMNTDKLKAGERYDLESAQGKEVDVFVENGEYNGNLNNRINH